MKVSLICFFIFSSLAKAEVADALRVIDLNKQGVEFLNNHNYLSAQQKFTEGLSRAPYSTELQINLGLSFDGIGNFEKARQAYELAARFSQNPEVRFVAHFNIAELAGRQKKIDEALNYYQLALQDKPDSIEVKTNIELLIQNQKKNGGSGQNKDKDKDKKNDQDQNQDKGQSDDNQKDKDKDKGKNKEKQGYQKDKPQPRQFKSEQLNQADVKKILEELDRQEQRVRAEYNKKQIKEKPRDKDW